MKGFKRKLKKANKGMLFFYLLGIILYGIGFGLLIHGILQLTGIETLIRILFISFFSLFGFCYILFGIITIFTKKKKTFIALSIFLYLFGALFGVVSYYIDKLYRHIDQFTIKDTVTYTTALIAMKDHEISSDGKIGMINNTEDIEGHVLALEMVTKENLKQEIVYYDEYDEMLNALYQGKIDGMFATINYVIVFSSEEAYENISGETYVVKQYSKEMKNQESSLVSNKKLTEPFTVLLMGVDSESEGLNPNAAFNGDTLMYITFNPKTLTATLFSIPRDIYAPIACNHNRYNKINSAAAYGTKCVIDTVQQFTGIEIDYYAKVNFQGVVQLVDAMGGVTVDVEKPDSNKYNGRLCEQDSHRRFGEYLVCMDPGIQKLNGEQALAYARCRYLYKLSDIDRNRHQQQIIEAIAKQVTQFDSLEQFENILNAISNNVATNLTKEQILSFYDVLKSMIGRAISGNEFIKINHTYLNYYSLPVYLPASGSYTSALGHYPGSLEEIVKAMKVNLGLEEETMIKTFNFDANDDYESGIIGKNNTSGSRIQLVPTLVGNSLSYAQNWASSHNITLIVQNVEGTKGLVINQSVHEGVLLSTINSMTVYVGSGVTASNEKPNNSSTSGEEPTIPGNPDKSESENNDLPSELDPSTPESTGNTTTNNSEVNNKTDNED